MKNYAVMKIRVMILITISGKSEILVQMIYFLVYVEDCIKQEREFTPITIAAAGMKEREKEKKKVILNIFKNKNKNSTLFYLFFFLNHILFFDSSTLPGLLQKSQTYSCWWSSLKQSESFSAELDFCAWSQACATQSAGEAGR